MPFYLHQWSYNHAPFREMLRAGDDRAEVVRTAVEAFGGTLHHFFYCFGEYDGTAIAEFPDREMALACLMSIFAEGRITAVHTTELFTVDEGGRAMQFAMEAIRSPQD